MQLRVELTSASASVAVRVFLRYCVSLALTSANSEYEGKWCLAIYISCKLHTFARFSNIRLIIFVVIGEVGSTNKVQNDG